MYKTSTLIIVVKNYKYLEDEIPQRYKIFRQSILIYRTAFDTMSHSLLTELLQIYESKVISNISFATQGVEISLKPNLTWANLT